MNYIIRKAEIGDVNGNLLNIFIEGYLYHYNNRNDKFNNLSETELKDKLLNNMKECNYLIIEENNIVVGYISYVIKEKVKRVLWIDELVVDSKYQKRGFGKSLIKEVESIAKKENCKAVELCCWSFNENGKNIYNHLDYNEQRIILDKEIF